MANREQLKADATEAAEMLSKLPPEDVQKVLWVIKGMELMRKMPSCAPKTA